MSTVSGKHQSLLSYLPQESQLLSVVGRVHTIAYICDLTQHDFLKADSSNFGQDYQSTHFCQSLSMKYNWIATTFLTTRNNLWLQLEMKDNDYQAEMIVSEPLCLILFIQITTLTQQYLNPNWPTSPCIKQSKTNRIRQIAQVAEYD